jgi:hypothetical protein
LLGHFGGVTVEESGSPRLRQNFGQGDSACLGSDRIERLCDLRVFALRDIVATFSRPWSGGALPPNPGRVVVRGALQRGLNQHALEHLSQLWRSIRTTPASWATWEPTATIGTLGGRKPKTFEEFVREEQSAFNGLSQ